LENIKIHGENFRELEIISKEKYKNGIKMFVDINGSRELFIRQWIED
jgi:hypothetical protein